MISGDAVALSGGTATFDSKAVGTGKTVTLAGAALTGTDAGNYILDSVATATANITALHITGSFTAASKVYDGGTAATVLTRSPVGVIGGDAVALYGGTAGFANKNVGTGKTVTLTGATLTGADAGNYVLDSVNTTTANITASHVTDSFTASNKVYDGNTSATVATRSPGAVVSGDVVSLSGGTAAFGNKNVGTGKTVTLTGAVLAGTDAGNYALDGVNTTTANITQTGLTVSGVTANNKPFDGNTTATLNFSGAALVGVISPDAVTLNTGSATGTFPSAECRQPLHVTIATWLLPARRGQLLLTQPTPPCSRITAWTLSGFFQPVGIPNTFPGAPATPPNSVWNTIKGGQAVPLKFELFASNGGTELTSVTDVTSFALAALPCSAGLEDPVDPDFTTTGSTVLRYTDGQFIVNWDSPKGANKCFRVTMTARDGSQLSTFFKTK